MAMSRRDYEAAARVLRESPEPVSLRAFAATTLCVVFAKDNPRFDRERFLRACDVPVPPTDPGTQ